MKRRFVCALTFALFFSVNGLSQSQGFKLGQWSEIHNSVLSTITQYYVDSLPVDKMSRSAIDAMLSNLDPYTVYVPESEQDDFAMMITKSYGGIGAFIYKPTKESNVIISEPFENSPASLSGLVCGDEITHVDGVSVLGMTADQATSRMKGKPGTKVVFTVRKVRTGEVVSVPIIREQIHTPDVEYYGMLDDRTGYILQTQFTEGVSKEVASAIVSLRRQGMQRLVLDLRGNGGGLLEEAVKIVALFVPKGTQVVSSKGTDGEVHYRTQTNPLEPDLPLLVLVDSGSASASEIVSGAIQDLDRGVIAGVRTFGKGLVQRVLPVSYNGQLKVTVAKYYTPSGRCVQAMDYSHRAEDGSVGNIPDSLTREFRTAGGRIVRDGGGITPDIILKKPEYSRVTYGVFLGGLTNNYPLEYVRTHESIPSAEEFHMSDADYDAFVEWAILQNFDCRSESETYYDLLVAQMKKDGEWEQASEALEAVEKIVKMDKRTALYRSRDEIQPFLEEEIVVRYYYQAAGVKVRLRTDGQLKEALSKCTWKLY